MRFQVPLGLLQFCMKKVKTSKFPPFPPKASSSSRVLDHRWWTWGTRSSVLVVSGQVDIRCAGRGNRAWKSCSSCSKKSYLLISKRWQVMCLPPWVLRTNVWTVFIERFASWKIDVAPINVMTFPCGERCGMSLHGSSLCKLSSRFIVGKGIQGMVLGFHGS